MSDPFVSIRGRVLINVEALNMTESVGNYVKHRRVPVIMPDTYATYFVPAISGESIAHGYQQVLADAAKNKGLPVCKLCANGYFLKSTNDAVFKEAFGKEQLPKTGDEFERTVIQGCVVEDVGGFLYVPPERGGRGEKKKEKEEERARNVKRTSNFFVGYMIPTKEALESVVIEPQLHTRYALGTRFVEREAEERGQMIYYIELSSAVYTFSFDLDTKYIGKTTFEYGKAGETVVNNRKERVNVALDAIFKFLTEMMFGAKKTRFLPAVEWESLLIAVSDDIWTVPSPFSKNYIDRVEEKRKRVNYNTKLFKYLGGPGFEEVIASAIEEAKNRVKE